MPDDDQRARDAAAYPLLTELDRLEDLLEEMDDLKVATRDDIEHRMAKLNAEIDRLSGV